MGNREPQIFYLESDMIRYWFAKGPFSGALEVGRDDKAWLAQIIRKKL